MTKAMVRKAGPLGACLAGVALAACDAGVESPTGPESAVEPAAPVAGMAVYGHGALRRASPGTACVGGAYDDFDFWIGDWDVYDPSDALIGRNIVTGELDGCAVVEHWVGSGGGSGESLNVYDAETGLWYQTYLASAAFAHLDMSGGPEAPADMRVRGERFFTGARTEGTWSWFDEGPDQVRQIGVTDVFFDGGGTASFTFEGVYRRVDRVAPFQPAEATACGSLPDLDFLTGDWRVSAARGPELGSSSIVRPAAPCMVRESFETAKGIRALTYLWWQPRPEGSFHLVYADTEGERIRLSGELVDGRLVLTGEEPAPGPWDHLRVTWGADGDGLVQTWSTSRDGGATWTERLTLEYTAG